MNDCPQSKKHCLSEKPDPVNPWLAEVVREYRLKRGDEYLRKRYKSFQDDNPGQGWEDFLNYVALEDKVFRDPFLLTPRKDFGLSQHLRDVLNAVEISNVADLLQFSIEEMTDVLEDQNEAIIQIEQFLANHGYKLYSYKEYTYKIPVLSAEKEQQEQRDAIKSIIDRTKERLETSDEPLPTRVMDAYSSLVKLEQMTRAAECSLREQLKVVIALGRLLEDNLADIPPLAKEAPWVCERVVYLAEMVHGHAHITTARANRLCGAIHSRLKEHEKAAAYYIASAKITAEFASADDRWVGIDYNSAAVCFSRILDFRQALECLLKSAEVKKKDTRNPKDLEEVYGDIATCYHKLGDIENEKKYKLLAASLRSTD